MYVWKLWRDSRSRLLVCAALGLIWVATLVYVTQGGWSLIQSAAVHAIRQDARMQQASWNGIAEQLLLPLMMIALLASLALAEVGLGGDLAHGVGELLLTRPRRRSYFGWAGWLFGAVLLFALMLVMTVSAMALLAYMTGTVLNWRALALPVLLLPTVILVFGAGYLISALTNGRNGAAMTFGLVILYLLLVPVVATFWHVEPPNWWFHAIIGWATRHRDPFPALPLIGWMALTLLFPLLVQWNLQRKEL